MIIVLMSDSGEEWRGEFREFIAANEFDASEVAALQAAVAGGMAYMLGGGAAPLQWVCLAPQVERESGNG